MSEPAQNSSRAVSIPPAAGSPSGANLADILERVLDKGIVIAGDIQVNLLDIELLTIKLRLLVASVDKAKEMGIDWWEHDQSLSSSAKQNTVETDSTRTRELEAENEDLRNRLDALEKSVGNQEVQGEVRGETSTPHERETEA